MSNLITTQSLALSNLSTSGMLCSKNVESDEDKKALYNALTMSKGSLKNHVNKEISLVDVIVDYSQFADEETGELKESASMIFFDIYGNSYGSNSYGVFKSLKNLIALYGSPTWEKGLKVTVKSMKVTCGDMIYFEM